jgi:hypothetical protein
VKPCPVELVVRGRFGKGPFVLWHIVVVILVKGAILKQAGRIQQITQIIRAGSWLSNNPNWLLFRNMQHDILRKYLYK